MSYNAFSKPRFYTNSIEHLYNQGNVISVDPIFLSSSWHNPKTYDLETSVTYTHKKEFKVKLSKGTLLYDFNYIMILGHNLNSSISSLRCFFTYEGEQSPTYSIRDYNLNMSSNISETTGGTAEDAWSVPSYNYVPIIIEVEPQSQLIDEITVILFNNEETPVPIRVSGISFGSYYDLPYNPDLGIKKSISYDNINTYDTISGKTLSSDFGSSKPFNPFVNVYNNATEQHLYDEEGDVSVTDSQDYTPSGRRSYDISYSYIGSSESGQNHLMPRDFNFYKDIKQLDYDHHYDPDKGNLYTSVINKTMGTHIPFIFLLNGSNPNELMLARFKDNNFSFDEVAPNVHNVSFGIREVW